MNQIAIEDIATVFASEFIKHTTFRRTSGYGVGTREMHKDFIKMNYARRRKIVEEVLDKIEADFKDDQKEKK